MCAPDPADTPGKSLSDQPVMAAAEGIELGGGLVPQGAAGMGRLQLRTGSTQTAPLRSTDRVASGILDTYLSPTDKRYGNGVEGAGGRAGSHPGNGRGSSLFDKIKGLANSTIGGTVLTNLYGGGSSGSSGSTSPSANGNVSGYGSLALSQGKAAPVNYGSVNASIRNNAAA